MILDNEWLLSCTRLQHDGGNVHQKLFWQGGSRACLKVALASFLASPPSALRTNRDCRGTSSPSSAFPVRLPPLPNNNMQPPLFCVFQEHLVAVVGGRALGRPTHGPALQLRLYSIHCTLRTTTRTCKRVAPITIHKRIPIPDAPFGGRLFAYELIPVLLY